MKGGAALAGAIVCACAVACIGPHARPAPAAPPPSLPGKGVAEQDLSRWRSFTRVSSRRFRSRGHGSVWVEVLVDPAFADAYRQRALPAAVGTRVVMAGFDGESGPLVGLTAMIKMLPGYSPDGGDWYYAALAPDGAVAITQGRLEICAACHRHAPGGDRLFGTRQIEAAGASPPETPPPPQP